MAIELITGVGEENHISSNDVRAFNRANFGQGKYILKDADNMEVTISPAVGNISISSGSCLWSGMHIRNNATTTLSYVVPAAIQVILVYLHYMKNADTGIESIEFVVSSGTALEPIIDNLGDNTIEAYTLFYSFFATSSSVSNITNGFVQAKSFEEIEKELDAIHEYKVLFNGSASKGSKITLNESFKNFDQIQFVASNGEIGDLRSVNAAIGGTPPVVMLGVGLFSNTLNTFARISTAVIKINSETEFEYQYGYASWVGSSVASSDLPIITKIIGFGRLI